MISFPCAKCGADQYIRRVGADIICPFCSARHSSAVLPVEGHEYLCITLQRDPDPGNDVKCPDCDTLVNLSLIPPVALVIVNGMMRVAEQTGQRCPLCAGEIETPTDPTLAPRWLELVK